MQRTYLACSAPYTPLISAQARHCYCPPGEPGKGPVIWPRRGQGPGNCAQHELLTATKPGALLVDASHKVRRALLSKFFRPALQAPFALLFSALMSSAVAGGETSKGSRSSSLGAQI